MLSDASNQSKYVVDVTAANFQQVIEQSLQMPVVLDLWSPSCAPCRELGPILERLAAEYGGRFLLGKVNVDDVPQVASAFGISSIPFVVAFDRGQPVNQFEGLLPEEQIRQWLDTFCPSQAQTLTAQALEIEESSPEEALKLLRHAAELEPGTREIQIHLARLLLAQGQEVETREIIERLEADGFLEPDAEHIKNQLDLLDVAEESGGVDEARKAAEADPENLELQLQLADALAVARKFEEAFEICLDIIRRDRTGVGEKAKESMVKMFDLAGQRSQLVADYRRRLTTLLY